MYTISGGAILRNHPKISCSRARFTLSGACLSDTYKKSSYMFAAAVCNIPAPIRASARATSSENLLLSGVFLPSRTLAFLTLIKRVRIFPRRRRLDNMYTIACVSSPQGKVRDTLRNARCLHSSLRLLLPTNRALFRPRQNSFGGDFALRRFEGTPEATSSENLLLSGALYPPGRLPF